MDEDMKNIIKGVIFIGGSIMLLVITLSAWVNVPQGTVGVVFDKSRGGVLPQTMGQGWHFRRPLVQWIQEYPVALRTYNALGVGEGSEKESNAINLPTQEGQHIQQDISVVYNVDPVKASFVFDKFKGADIEDIEVTFIRRMVISVANNIAGKYSIMEIYGPKKAEVQQKMFEALQPEMQRWGFNLDRVNLGASKFPETIEAALQQKVQAQQAAESAKFKLEQAEIDKKSAIALAEGQARANELLQASLTPKLVNLKWIEKWNGELPTYMLGNSVPMVSLGKADQ